MTDYLSVIRSMRERRQSEPASDLARVQAFGTFTASRMKSVNRLSGSPSGTSWLSAMQAGQPQHSWAEHLTDSSEVGFRSSALTTAVQSGVCRYCSQEMAPEALKCPRCQAWQVLFSPQWAPVRPWVRYWARMLDLSLLQVMASWTAWQISQHDPYDIELVCWSFVGYLLFMAAGWMLLESAALAGLGTTPGKWLLNIRVSQSDGRDLTFRQAFQRTALLWLKGMGLKVPMVNLVMNVLAYHHLTAYHATPWDQSVRDAHGQPLQVQHGRVGILRSAFAVTAFIGLGLAGLVFVVLLNTNLNQAYRLSIGAH